MATVDASATGSNTGSAWRTEQHSAVTDQALSDFPLQRYNLLMTNTLRVNQLSFEAVSSTESLSATLPELEAYEVNDLLMTTQAITAVRSNCEELKNTAVSTGWLPATLFAGSMSDGLFGLRYTIYTHSRVTMQLLQSWSTAFLPLWKLASHENLRDTVPQL